MYKDSTGTSVDLPSWITFDSSTQILTVDPDKTVLGDHTLVATYTTLNGEDITFDAMIITAECAVASFTKPDNPSNVEYTVWNVQESLRMTDYVYTQTPDCGYTYTGVYTYTGLNTYVVEKSNDNAQINVNSMLASSAGSSPYPITVAATLTIVDGANDSGANNNGGTTEFVIAGTVDFDVEITNPCPSTTIIDVDLGAGITVVNGETETLIFAAATDSVENSHAIYTLCGERSYKVTTPGSGAQIPWITIEDNGDGTWTVTASPTDETIVGTNNYELFITLDDYYDSGEHSGMRQAFDFIVEAAPCECGEVLWTPPVLSSAAVAVGDSTANIAIPAATIDQAASEALSPQIRACYADGGPGCVED